MKLKVESVLDREFIPLSLVCREMRENTKNEGQDIVIGIERNNGQISTFRTRVYKDGIGKDDINFRFIERIVKALLWVRGGYKIIIAGSPVIGKKIKKAYEKDGLRAFDNGFMARVYELPFEVVLTTLENAPETKEASSPVGRHLDGCRIGFDAGGSDRKVSAVIDGEAVYSEEVVWHPKLNSDPEYHYQGILDAMRTAAKHMPRVDAIGVSSAGVYISNRIMVASLFLKVSDEDFEKRVKSMYLDVAKQLGRDLGKDIPIEVANDGDVTALAGAMELNDNNVLGIAMGTSEAGGYVDSHGNITGWLNELAFVPVDFNENAMVDEWSGDYGCGVKYFSQDGVIKLAPLAGIELDEKLTPAEKLKAVQKLMAEGDERAVKIFDNIGVYFGYAIAFYAEFYDIKHVLIMGRVTSGKGGEIILHKAREVLDREFPELASKIELHIPDESSRRVGQSVAAASLPEIK
ncbi:MAG: ROK family protein [Clostridiales bacterium]|jgi:predicted NBD/HSP70 family sugar kinase|nr:ROK family protein [Clostridiales bacterium]